ncbi:MAG: hypothetical protein ACNA7O_04090 [Rhodobacterales bacterium]
MSNSGTFVYLLEEDMVADMLPGWPAQMQVAVCLTPGGACDLAVHHQGETARVLTRILALHGLSRFDLCVAPHVEGYPTRKVLFSEEQQLLSLVADSPHLAELASDYAINYRFAQDEGLDPEAATGNTIGRQTAGADKPATVWPDAHETKTDAMSARSQAYVTHLSLPSGYAAPTMSNRPECVFVEARLQREGDTVRLIIAPDGANGKEPAVTVTRIGCRDDFARFVLPRNALDGWKQGDVAVLEMPEDAFPVAMVERFMCEPYLCHVTVTVRGVFVSPVAPFPGKEKTSTPAIHTRKPRAKRRLFRSVHVAVAALVGIMLVTGHFAAALDRSPARSSAAQSVVDDANADAALDLIAKMAGGDSG